jgi:hypothetical protein
MSNADELRSKLPTLAREMYEAIEFSLTQLREARRHDAAQLEAAANGHALPQHLLTRIVAHKKGLDDALLVLRAAQEAHEKFQTWMSEVIDLEPDHCGVTAEERAMLFGGGAGRGPEVTS